MARRSRLPLGVAQPALHHRHPKRPGGYRRHRPEQTALYQVVQAHWDEFRERAEQVTARHLARRAYLYVRQSTVRQVIDNVESTKRQYVLRQRAVALGWPSDSVVVIDSDLGDVGGRHRGRLEVGARWR